jgi:hypothetical protein
MIQSAVKPKYVNYHHYEKYLPVCSAQVLHSVINRSHAEDTMSHVNLCVG